MRSLGLFVLASVLIHQSCAEREIFCPNNAVPKSDIKCLPGQSESNNVCGQGYSCYFSGLNYHCCPSGDEADDKKSHGECPDYTVALLDSSGHPVRCSIGNQCPENMYCNEDSSVPICCQNVKGHKSSQQQIDDVQKQEELQAVEEFFNSEDEQPVKEPECPSNSLSVLNEDGEVTFCTTAAECPQSGMFCHGTDRKICCESIETVGVTTKKAVTNSINIRPSSTESPTTTASKVESKPTTIEIKSVADLVTSRPPTQDTTKSTKIGLSEASYKKNADRQPPKEAGPKARASKTLVFDENNKPIKYEPHVSGGYAVSQPVDKLNEVSNANKKEIVQQYLLEQIKQGWPYSESFFRPREQKTAVIRGNPTAVVHFN